MPVASRPVSSSGSFAVAGTSKSCSGIGRSQSASCNWPINSATPRMNACTASVSGVRFWPAVAQWFRRARRRYASVRRCYRADGWHARQCKACSCTCECRRTASYGACGLPRSFGVSPIDALQKHAELDWREVDAARFACVHTKRLRSRRFAYRFMPSPLHHRTLIRSPRRARNTSTCMNRPRKAGR